MLSLPLTPAAARLLLLDRAAEELAEERLNPPAWSPFRVAHQLREISGAMAAARTRAEHARRLADLPDRDLARMLADGWHPLTALSDNARYVR